MIYYNWHNRREIYETDRLLGKGGEGSVYSIKNNRNLVLKEFFPANRTGDRYQKILFMVQHPLKSSYFQAAWPCTVVCDSNSQFVGYTMPCIPIQDKINQIYEANSKYNFRDRVTVAANLCAAIDSVHKAGYVCGDLKYHCESEYR